MKGGVYRMLTVIVGLFGYFGIYFFIQVIATGNDCSGTT